MRLLWMLDAGLPRPLVNVAVTDDRGRQVAVVDLLDPETGLVGEYDGAHHSGAAQRSRDDGRVSRLRDLGLRVLRMTSTDLSVPQRAVTVARLRAARSAKPLHRGWRLGSLEPLPPVQPLALHRR